MTPPIPAIGPVTAADAPGQRSAAFDAELAHYRRQLAEWRNGPSGKASEGRPRIAQIEHRMSEPSASGGDPPEQPTQLLSGLGGLLDIRA